MIKEELGKRAELVNRRIAELIGKSPEELYGPMRHLLDSGGKRIRSSLCLLACEAGGGKAEDAIDFASAVELVHNFTLIHDDIMDNDRLRRGKPSVHAKYGVPYAINSGDGMFAIAFQSLGEAKLDAGRKAKGLEILSRAVREVSEGQALDLSFVEKDVKVDEYMEMVQKKTGVLLEAAVKLGCIAAGKDENLLENYGKSIGVAFQIYDDILGLTADEKVLGKPVGNDLAEGKKTLMVVHCLENAEEGDRKRLLGILGDKKAGKKEVDEAIGILEKTGSVEFARKKAEGLVGEAKKALGNLEESEAKKILEELADYIVERKY